MPIANFFITKILKAYRDLNYYDEDDVECYHSLALLLDNAVWFCYGDSCLALYNT